MNPSTQTGAPKTSAKRKGNGVTSPSRRGGSGRVLTDVIVDLGFVDQEAMDAAVGQANDSGGRPERLLVADGLLTEDQLARAVAERFGLDHIDLAVYRVDPDAAKLVTPAAVRRYRAVPIAFPGERTLLVAMSDPANVLAQDDIAVMTGYEIRPAVASPTDIDALLERLEDPNFGNGATAPLDDDDDPEAEAATPSPQSNAPAGADVRPARPDADQLRGVGRGRVGHPARAPRDQGGRRARLVGHPLRARRRGHARALPDRRRAPRGRHDPRQRRARRGLAHEDPLRPGHRRAPRAAGRPHLARGRRAGRSTCASRRSRARTARTSSCESSTRARS